MEVFDRHLVKRDLRSHILDLERKNAELARSIDELDRENAALKCELSGKLDNAEFAELMRSLPR